MSESDQDMRSESVIAPCREAEGEFLEVFRIGPPDNVLSVIAVEAHIAELSFGPDVDHDEDDDELGVATIIINPSDARRMAVALIDFADQCEGTFTSFFPQSQGSDGL